MNCCSEPPVPGGSVASEPGRQPGGGAVPSSSPAPAVPPSAAAATTRLALGIAYDGAPFRGFAENDGVSTVAGELRRALERTLRQPVELTCAGRTDAGVHARGQVVTFEVDPARLLRGLDGAASTADHTVGAAADDTVSGAPVDGGVLAVAVRRLRNSLNSQLAPQIVVRSAEQVSADFDARFSAQWRLYRYTVLNSPVPDPFLARTSWWVSDPLDPDALANGSDRLLGEHDFSSFCRRPKGPTEVSLVRRVLLARWTAGPDDLLSFEIAGSSFCHQMVRSVVGTLVDVGRGRRAPDDIAGILAARDRNAASNIAPPQGLCLWQVGYSNWPEGADLIAQRG